MANKAKIKESAKDTVIGYNNSGKPLGQRTDHDELAIIAQESGRKDYKDLFEILPSLEELKGNKVDALLSAQLPVAPSVPVTRVEGLAGRTPDQENK